jgi:hypothetical protein
MPLDKNDPQYIESVYRALADLLDFRRAHNLPVDPWAPAVTVPPLAMLVIHDELAQRERVA